MRSAADSVAVRSSYSFWRPFAVWFVAVAIVAAAGTLFRPDAWFAALAKPSFNPPSVVFAPVWSALYLLMAIAAALVASVRTNDTASTRARCVALVLMGGQLVLNGAWSAIFFGAHAIGLALMDIAALWSAIVATTIAFWRVRPLSGALLVPYLAWVSFASALNFAIYRLN
jgi:benzodiazapine receptor